MAEDKAKRIRSGRGALIAPIAVFCLFAVMSFFARPAVVSGSSMEPALSSGDVVLVNIMAYRSHSPAAGDIVLVDKSFFASFGGAYSDGIKRVAALPGSEVTVDGQNILVDEEAVQESSKYPFRIGEDHVFLLGDNQEVSLDSRQLGTAGATQIKGKAWIKIFPPLKVL